MHFHQQQRMKNCNEENFFESSRIGNLRASHYGKKEKSAPKVTDYSDPSAIPNLLEGLHDNKYGSVTEDIKSLLAELKQWTSAIKSSYLANSVNQLSDVRASPISEAHSNDVIELDADADAGVDFTSVHQDRRLNTELGIGTSVIVLDSDEEDGDYKVGTRHVPAAEHKACNSQARLRVELQTTGGQALSTTCRGHFDQLACHDPGNSGIVGGIQVNWQPSVHIQKVTLNAIEKKSLQDAAEDSKKRTIKHLESSLAIQRHSKKRAIEPLEGDLAIKRDSDMEAESDSEPDSNMEINKEDDDETSASDGLEDLWKEMSLAVEYSKDTAPDDYTVTQRDEEECDHSYILKDDMGLVCRICGIIQKSITTIFDYQWRKGSQITRTYVSDPRKSKDADETIKFSGVMLSEDDFIAAEISIHPRHLKQMKPHQIEGFNFLVRNLVVDKPGGCILAHAPGSGKTFMLISFIQSFLAKYPLYRPLVILPKGIVSTWKREFQRWQVEDIPLYDFYSVKADHRNQQFEVLKSWQENKSILFMGYKQFSTIICDGGTSKEAAACKEILLKVPGLLILDEGHTPRNEETNVLCSISNVQTPRKVVLSGTLFQNRVKEVFNILNLVRHNFLKLESSRAVVRRILGRVNMSGSSRRYLRTDVDTAFYELVEETLQCDDDFRRKVTVIRDLREMTQNVLHYYKGDFLDELPGLVDFAVLLKLSPKQKDIIPTFRNLEKFKRISVGSSVYVHPQLRELSDYASDDKGSKLKEEKIDSVLDKIDERDGVKTQFFLDILRLAESAGEKVLVFSQYLLPLKFLEKLVIRRKGWRPGKEIFMILGDTSTELREKWMELFNSTCAAKVFFGSIKACGEGISLVGASRVIILDVHLNPSVTRQAIGRTFRPGQTRKVYTYRLIAADSPEEEDHNTCFKKELISKMWFEWSEFSGDRDFELERVDVQDCQDSLLENLPSVVNVKALYRR